ncbi:hypothetical protein HHX47_DHR2000863 [Lentinula edodes]|nr:hypothetical protein HHX47_DHR2000863 [Lentinula edodes]
MTKTTIPITVFTGFLGAGKTTVILSLLPKLPKDNKVVLLKNEYGDVEVIDAENFAGYEDTSPTAKMQASYTDVILITRNYSRTRMPTLKSSPVDEVQTLTLYRGSTASLPHKHGDDHEHAHEHSGAANPLTNLPKLIMIDTLEECLTKLGKESVWRVKGFVRVQGVNDVETYIVNWAFGRYELTKSEPSVLVGDCSVQLTAMGEQGELRRAIGSFCRALELSIL